MHYGLEIMIKTLDTTLIPLKHSCKCVLKRVSFSKLHTYIPSVTYLIKAKYIAVGVIVTNDVIGMYFTQIIL